jgi:hypothetical protein
VGCHSLGAALTMWLASPPHAAILCHPGLTHVGAACDGWAATVSCQMGQAAAVTDRPTCRMPSPPLSYRRGLFRRWRCR